MSPKNIVSCLLLLMFYGCSGSQSSNQSSSSRPNILLFLVDDMGWTDTSVPFWKEEVDNNHFFKTPHMERLASQSYVFTEAYSSSPVCSPSRVAIMTGHNPMRTGVTNWIPGEAQEESSRYLLPRWNQEGLRQGQLTLPSVLADAGYATLHIGKAHFASKGSPGADPENLGFGKSYAGTHIGSPQTFFPPYFKGDMSWRIPDLEEYAAQGMYLTDAITAVALKALDSLSRQDAPFFMHLSHYAVHTPIEAKEAYVKQYRKQGKSETEAKYAAMVQSMDESLGQVMQKIEELGLEENTVILFASDNGGHVIKAAGSPTVNYPATAGKGFRYEGAYRVPFMMKVPHHQPQRVVYPTISEDIFSTILAVADVFPDDYPVDGVDLLSIISEGKSGTEREKPLFWHYPHYWAGEKIRGEEGIEPFTAIRKGKWKYVYSYDNEQSYLYNLEEDIEEQRNLVKEYAEKAQELVDLLVPQMQKLDARRPIDRLSGEPVSYPHL